MAALVSVVSIRRADYWLVEEEYYNAQVCRLQFQSAGRIIGWLKLERQGRDVSDTPVSIRRADYWLDEAGSPNGRPHRPPWRFNPPGGLLVG